MTKPTPGPWPEDLTPLLVRGDTRLLLRGKLPQTDCRVLSEENYQHARAAVNMLTELQRFFDRNADD